MNEVNEKRSGSSEASACSAAEGSQLTKIGGRSADAHGLACEIVRHLEWKEMVSVSCFDNAVDVVREVLNKYSVTEGP